MFIFFSLTHTCCHQWLEPKLSPPLFPWLGPLGEAKNLQQHDEIMWVVYLSFLIFFCLIWVTGIIGPSDSLIPNPI